MAIKDIPAQKGSQTVEVKFHATGSGSSTQITVSTHHGAGFVENRISITLSSARTTPKCTTTEVPEGNAAACGNVRKRKAWQISQAEESTCSSTQYGCYEKPHVKRCTSELQGSPYPLADQHKASTSTANTLDEKKSWKEEHAKTTSNRQKRKQTRRPSFTKTKASSANSVNDHAREDSNRDDPAPAEEQVTPVEQHSTKTCTHFHCTYEIPSNAGALTWFLKLFSR